MAADPLDLITIKEAKGILFSAKETSDAEDERIQACITSVSQELNAVCGRVFAQPAAPYSEARNGNGRRALWAMNPPIAGTPTVTENGRALVVSVGYSTSADVIVDPGRGVFYRSTGPTVVPLGWGLPGRWQPGVQNVVLGYVGGYAPASLPADLKGLVKYMVGHAWKQYGRDEVGISQRAFGQGTLTLLEDLPDFYKRVLDFYTRPMVPEP